MDIDDLLKGYREDPNYPKGSDQLKEAMAKRMAELENVEHDFVAAWQSRGFYKIESAGDIMQFKRKLSNEEVEFVLKWVPKISNEFGSQETLVRALILAAKPFDGQALMDLFDDPESSFNLKWAIGNTIDSTKVLNVVEWLKSKFQSLSLGKEKEMLVCALGKYLDTDEAREYLEKVFDNYPLHAADTLAKIGGRSDLDFIVSKLASYKGPGKAVIKKSIKKLEKKLLKNGL
jgi:hypothetical protein